MRGLDAAAGGPYTATIVIRAGTVEPRLRGMGTRFLSSFAILQFLFVVAVRGAVASCDLWTYGYNSPASDVDQALGAAFDQTGNLVVAGFENRPDLGQDKDWRVTKLDRSGAVVWSRSFASAGGTEDVANAVTTDNSNNVVVAGWSSGNWLVRKYTAAGDDMWFAAGSVAGAALSVACDSTGNVFVTGYESGAPGTAVVTRKYLSTGSLVWSRSHYASSSNEAEGCGIAVTAQGGSVVGGYAVGPGGDPDWLILKYDTAGNLQFARTYDGSGGGGDKLSGIAVAPDGRIVAAGTLGGEPPTRPTWSVASFDSEGSQVWQRVVMGAFDASDRVEVAVDSGGRIATVGFPCNSSSANSCNDPSLHVFDRGGTKIWSAAIPYMVRAMGVAVHGEELIAVVGYDAWDRFLPEQNWYVQEFLDPAACPGHVKEAEHSKSYLVVYPNPVSGDWFSVKVPSMNATIELEVLNGAFQRVWSGTYTNEPRSAGGVTVRGVSRWAPGVYYVVAKEFAGVSSMARVVVKR